MTIHKISNPRIIDGDTILVSIGGKNTLVRFRWIDAPECEKSPAKNPHETNQYIWGKKATLILMIK
jgi:endonuclease YncB( thermonuclease family)